MNVLFLCFRVTRHYNILKTSALAFINEFILLQKISLAPAQLQGKFLL